ncbi:2-amino-4-hydroxy-6-hydroxymethyldihydropteridine diphosphokinase [Alteribacter keqinensis]|uniref:2-amino-4-hydroxy-6-hydroxymethyldihydropteridine diphosphokinase n=1 Tax=Alteribacter keqinensis TaxID=2483800 RepID=A0A3M7TKH8_9BACI|nr:2-amino-4-hydroxy-6-hydroxymethyldihydropteridine diphosphokinase [Alteribacter keqinensis]RNA66013.1 2-amino-4-hydroxy-6-hydroxymethyldihydropteridine diphosphokinase [Alteribacter keqinensis]
MNRQKAYIALGSNIGERHVYLEGAVDTLEDNPDITIEKKSSIYETDPVGYTDQPPFLNMVVKVATSLSPLALLDKLQKIESTLGRTRDIHWGPRTIDLDILLYNDENIKLERLSVPHPRMYERGFVLVPLCEIEPDLRFPDGRHIEQCVHDLTDKEGVRKWKESSGADESAPFGS